MWDLTGMLIYLETLTAPKHGTLTQNQSPNEVRSGRYSTSIRSVNVLITKLKGTFEIRKKTKA